MGSSCLMVVVILGWNTQEAVCDGGDCRLQHMGGLVYVGVMMMILAQLTWEALSPVLVVVYFRLERVEGCVYIYVGHDGFTLKYSEVLCACCF